VLQSSLLVSDSGCCKRVTYNTSVCQPIHLTICYNQPLWSLADSPTHGMEVALVVLTNTLLVWTNSLYSLVGVLATKQLIIIIGFTKDAV